MGRLTEYLAVVAVGLCLTWLVVVPATRFVAQSFDNAANNIANAS